LLASAEHHFSNDTATYLASVATAELILKESSLKIVSSALRNMRAPSSSPKKKEMKFYHENAYNH